MLQNQPVIIKDYDPALLTTDYLYNNNDWNLVELNYNLDVDKLTQWFHELRTEFKDIFFTFDTNPDKLDLAISHQLVKQGYCGIDCGPIEGLTMAWPTERYETLPPPSQANKTMFPEVNLETFNTDAKILSRYRKGYLEELIQLLGEDSFRQLIVTSHHPRMVILQHIDSKLLKLHIPVETNENAYFVFGEHKELGKYHMKLGKIYILNAHAWHGTSNEGNTMRSHIITRITPECVQRAINL